VEYFYNVIFIVETFMKTNFAMGASNSRHISTTGRENVKFKYAVSSVQGLKDKQNDAVSNLLALLNIIGRILFKVSN
jgi:hypothetical protein